MKRLFAVLCCLAGAAFAQTEERIAGSNPDGSAISLKAVWFAAKAQAAATTQAGAKAPAVLLLHGCGGPYAANAPAGTLSQRMKAYAALLNAEGYHALVLDSLTPRGERELCTQKIGERKLTQAHRRLDVQAAFSWLTTRPDVDPERLALLGWSNGGSTVLASTDAGAHRYLLKPAPRAAAAFYPGCETALKAGYAPVGPTLLMVGASDDWTPAAPCAELAKGQPQIRFQSYAGAYHNFDGTSPVRVRREVPNGVNPGAGVTVGGNPAAKAASQAELLRFLKAQLSQ